MISLEFNLPWPPEGRFQVYFSHQRIPSEFLVALSQWLTSPGIWKGGLLVIPGSMETKQTSLWSTGPQPCSLQWTVGLSSGYRVLFQIGSFLGWSTSDLGVESAIYIFLIYLYFLVSQILLLQTSGVANWFIYYTFLVEFTEQILLPY